MSRAAGWLRPRIEGMTRGSDLSAYAAYALALAGTKDAAVFDAVARRQDSMTAYGIALYGLALRKAGRSGAEEIAGRLERLVKEEGGEAYWPVDRDTLMDFHGETTAEATAYAVKLLANVRPASPLLPKAAAWLVNHRHGGYYWNSTKQTAMVIYGTTDYLRISGELKPDISLTVSANGRLTLSRRFTASDAFAAAPHVIRIAEKELGGAKQSLEFRTNGTGTLYWSAEASYYTAEDRPAREGGFPLGLRREYFKLSPGRQEERIVYGIHPLDGPVSPGDLIAVRLVLEGTESHYLLLEDPIPAGTEAIERDDLYEIAGRSRWWNWWYTRRELRDDRVALFQTFLNARDSEFWYLLKVVNPGQFRISPARASGMYEPGRFATSAPASLEVRP
jgi:hypothetical protein